MGFNDVRVQRNSVQVAGLGSNYTSVPLITGVTEEDKNFSYRRGNRGPDQGMGVA